MRMLKNNFEINKSSLFYTIIWICFFLSININPEDIYKLNTASLGRLVLPFVLACLLMLFLLKKNNLDYKNNIVTTAPFISYIVIVSIFLLINKNSNSYLNIYWGVAMLIPYMYLLFFRNDLSQLKQKLVWSLLLIIFVFIYFMLLLIYPILVEKKLIHFYGIYIPTLSYIDSNNFPPRSSGVARMALVVSISATIYLLFRKNNFYASFLLFILVILSSTFCLLFQSRTMSFIYLCLMFLLTLIILYKNFIKNYKKCLLLLLMPFVLSLIYNHYLLNQNNKVSKTLSQNQVSTNVADIINSSKNLFTRNQKENFSSNRFENWKTIIEISRKDKFIIGYGFQADRKLINQSVHNVYLYALISGGILGLVLIICISIRSAWTSFFLLFNYSILKKKLEPIDLISSFLMLSFLLRGLLETSYGIYSIDYLFFIICYFINEVNYRKFIGAQS
jgi:hypothetical protein